MKGVTWTTCYAIGDGGVLIVLVTFDQQALRTSVKAEPAAVRFAIQELTKMVRLRRAEAKRREYSALH